MSSHSKGGGCLIAGDSFYDGVRSQPHGDLLLGGGFERKKSVRDNSTPFSPLTGRGEGGV